MNFKEQREYIEKNKRIDGHKFDKATDITMMIDFLNNERERKMNENAEEEIHSISQFIARMMTRKIILLKGKQ
jgi:hypothetical protein